jgi:hypothetical protein
MGSMGTVTDPEHGAAPSSQPAEKVTARSADPL